VGTPINGAHWWGCGVFPHPTPSPLMGPTPPHPNDGAIRWDFRKYN
jgi:hypothetical protein